MTEQIENILSSHALRKTGCREEVLRLFLHRNIALAHGDIEHAMFASFDRVTVYRTLKTFLDKGILHKVLDDSGSMKYALCRDTCAHEEHHHQHIHFKCITCGNTTCIEEVHIPNIKLPAGYVGKETDILVQGTCILCNLQLA